MNKQEFVEKNKAHFTDIIETCVKMINGSLIPKLTLTLINVKRLSLLFGYSSLISFLKEDEEVLSEKYENADSATKEKMERIGDLISNQCIDGMKETEAGNKLAEEGELTYNILNSISTDWESGINFDELLPTDEDE